MTGSHFARQLPCSYAAMVEQRERYLRTHQGPDRFTYDCKTCRLYGQCPSSNTPLGAARRGELEGK